MQIKDLDQSRELSAEEQAAVQGGDAISAPFVAGNGNLVSGNSLFAINASPTTVTSVAVDDDTFTAVDIDSTVKSAVANVTGSLGTGIVQLP